MNQCKSFLEELSTYEPGDGEALSRLERHADVCPDCRAVLARELRLLGVLRAFDRAVPDVDRTAAIVARCHGQRSHPTSWLLGLLAAWFRPSPSLAYGMVSILLVLGVLGVLRLRHPGLTPTPPESPLTWECVLLSGEGVVDNVRVVASLVPIKLPVGTKLDLMAGGIAKIIRGEHTAGQFAGGRLQPTTAGLWVDTGRLELEVEPLREPDPFVVTTPLASVTVIGTRFALSLDDRSLTVSVDSGRVKLSSPRETIDLGSQMTATVDAYGIIRASMSTHPTSAPPASPAIPTDPVPGPEVPTSPE